MSYRSGIVDCFFFAKTIATGKKKFSNCIFGQGRKYCTVKDRFGAAVHESHIMIKIQDNPLYKACMTEDVSYLKKLFEENGQEIRIVGGAVRDLLIGIKPEDLDFATTATPEEMKEMFEKNAIRLINNNGEKHGTITARIKDRNFEITTLRVDKVTDGRHAEVQFTRDWALDANRRDLTINSLFLDFNGCLYDYFGGYEDLKQRKIRFVGCADERIKEDYLRILRYFRFYGKIAQEPDNHFEDVLEAIRKNAPGLGGIAGERIWTELNKIVTGNFVYEILSKIIKLNVGQYIGIPEKCNLTELKNVTDRMKKNQVSMKPITVLTALFNTQEELDNFFARIKPSSFDQNLGYFILFNKPEMKHEKPIRLFQKYIINCSNQGHGQIYSYELLKYKGNMELLKELEKWEVPKFPLNGTILKNKGIKGKNIGIVLNKLKEIWVDHDFNIDEVKLLEHASNIISNLSHKEHNLEEKLNS